jgi:predicted nuclease of predicted toxin-antitoxin system
VRFLLDENAEARIAAFLLGRGHDPTRVGHDYPAGLPDEEVLALAYEESRVLITNDKDFGELVVRGRRPHAGVILFRFPPDSTAQAKIEALEEFLASHPRPPVGLTVLHPRGGRTAR